MPMYDYNCPECRRKDERFLPLSRFNEAVKCSCGATMNKAFNRPPAYHDVPFDSVDFEVTGDPFVYHTRGQLKEHARRHGLEVKNFGVSHRNHGETV